MRLVATKVRRALGLGGAGVFLLLATACGSSESSVASTTTGASAAPGGESSTTSTTSTTSVGSPVIEVAVTGGSVAGGVRRHKVELGAQVTLLVVSDVAEEVHVHGYDETLDLTAGRPDEISFTADIPGVFEVELELSGLKLLELEVS